MMENNYHYQIIARALADIRARAHEQPSLADLAAAQNMSPAHFQRVFTEWVGISPKRYLEHLTLAHAKRALVERTGTINAAIDAGLSGTGRLYDLMLKWEAMTPGEFAKRGAGLTFGYGVVPTPFGDAVMIAGDRGLTAMGFVADQTPEETLNDYRTRWPNATILHDPERIAPYAAAIAQNKGELKLNLWGTPFQIAVWRALLAIPEGRFSSYSHIAEAVGKPTATRAVGTAVGRNPLAWLIPCHRVIRASGDLGGYHWGLPVKDAMITHEAARAEEVVCV